MREKMLIIAERLDKRADAIFQNLHNEWERECELHRQNAHTVRLKGDDLPPLPYPKNQMAGALRIFAEEIRETLEPVEYHEFDPKYGELFTIEEFEKQCGVSIIDSDGKGYYAKQVDTYRFSPHKARMMKSNLIASPRRIIGGDVNSDFTHVCWYNK